MWCTHCQQDVPAVAQTSHSPPSCPRCRRQLRPEQTRADLGHGKTAMQGLSSDEPVDSGASIVQQHDSEERLRRIRRNLRPIYRLDLGVDAGQSSPHFGAAAPPVVKRSEVNTRRRPHFVNRGNITRTAGVAWGLSTLLVVGSSAVAAGVTCLAWAASYAHHAVWQWGMTVTIAGEAALIIGMTLMAIRLWRNGRKLNTQLDGVDRQLSEIQYVAGRLAHSRQSCSQAYYDHFGAAASPPIALANLQGQLEQLAARLER